MQTRGSSESVRAFLPTRDFGASRAFYEALGFEKILDSDVAIFRAGGGAFILQQRYQKEWAENCMMQLMVDDLDEWWTRNSGLELHTRFGVTPPRPPAAQPWGLRVAFVYDPAGVLWHVTQRRPGSRADL